MHVKAKLTSYEKLPFTITVGATVDEWREALKQLEQLKNRAGYIDWPLNGLAELITKMLLDLDKTHADILIREPEKADTAS